MDSSTIEKLFVSNAYSSIATSFSYSRTSVWQPTIDFVKSLVPGSVVLDAGCGNGRNMKIRDDIKMIGFDQCPELISICKSKNLDVFISDIRHIQLMDESVDAIICIAVIGHIHDESDRIDAVNELLRVVKDNGTIFLQCWNKSAVYHSKKTNKFREMDSIDDYIVTFGKENIERYYHLFDEDTLRNLLEKCNCHIYRIYDDPSGTVAIIKKKKYI